MATLTDVVKNKIVEMQHILGDAAAQKALKVAEEREAAAEAAGIELKGDDPVANKDTKKKDEQEVDETEGTDENLKLSDLLAELEAGLDSGAIVDDVSEEDVTETAQELKEADAAFRTALKEVVEEVFERKFKEFATTLAVKEASANPAVVKLQKEMADNEAKQATLKEQMDELLGVQPKKAPFKASADQSTVVAEKDKANIDQPHADPVNSFISDFVLAPNANGNGRGV